LPTSEKAFDATSPSWYFLPTLFFASQGPTFVSQGAALKVKVFINLATMANHGGQAK